MIRTISKTAKIKPAVHDKLNAFLEQQRQLWNAALQERRDCYEKTGKAITRYDQYKSLTEIREDADFSQYHLKSQRSVLNHLDDAFQGFFQRIKNGDKPGYPRFKGRNRNVRSFEIPTPRLNGRYLKVKGIGNFKIDAVPEGKIKLCRVVKSSRRVVVHFVVETENTKARVPDQPIGIDLGLKDRAILSSGMTLDKVNLDRRTLKRLQRKLARAKLGSNTRNKKRISLQKEWERIRIKENNHLHRETTKIVNQHNRIAIEDLKIKNMVKNPNLARAIHEQKWGKLIRMLTYKAESAGGEVVRVNPHHTSTDCSVCGHRQKMPLNKRVFDCEGCGVSIDRDVNASRNILQRGIAQAGWAMEPLAPPGASESVRNHHVAASAGQDAERYLSKVA